MNWGLATTLKADLETLSEPQIFGCPRKRNDWVKVPSELELVGQAWSVVIPGLVNSIGDAVSTRPGLTPPKVKVGTSK